MNVTVQKFLMQILTKIQFFWVSLDQIRAYIDYWILNRLESIDFWSTVLSEISEQSHILFYGYLFLESIYALGT